MKILTNIENIWDFHPTSTVVVTTNQGWNAKGQNVMGRGIAKEAKLKYPDLPREYGEFCRFAQENSGVKFFPNYNVICFPTKPLNKEFPYLSWKSNSSLDLIEASLSGLVTLVNLFEKAGVPFDKVCLPPPGCGNGNLNLYEVMPLLTKYLVSDIFCLCLRNN